MSDVQAKLLLALENLYDYLGQHIQITLVALGIGIGLSLPLAVWASRSKALRWPAMTLASVIQTIPSIALLALFYPLLLGIAYLTNDVLGLFWFSALGFLPSVLALTLYSVLPILRNTVTAILGVEPSVTEAARGMGMTPRQVLFKVELPLATPVIIAGIRTATVWVVGIATLSTPVGQTSLGNYIFTGLQTENWISVLFGCVVAAMLAIVLDQLIGLIESAALRRSKPRALIAACGLLVVIGCGLAPVVYQEEPDFVVGAKTFSEQFILADLLEERLERAGWRIDVREGLGSTVAFKALSKGDVDCYVDYSGTIWANQMKREETPEREVVLQEVETWMAEEHDITLVGPLGFENAYALAMRREQAEELGIRTMADLAAYSADMTVGGDYEFFGRPEWETMKSTYGLQFSEKKQYQSTFMYKAVQNGEVDVISAFTTDGRIAAYDLVTLEDPRRAIPPYDALLLVSQEAAETEGFIEAIEPLVGAIDINEMRHANELVDLQKKTRRLAADYLSRELDPAEMPGR